MTEAEWWACPQSREMLGRLTDASDRKLRLLVVASCRRIWLLLPGDGSRESVDVAERFADGRASLAELDGAFRVAESEIDPEAFDAENPAYWVTARNMDVGERRYGSAGFQGSTAQGLGWCAGFRAGAAIATPFLEDLLEVVRAGEEAAQAELIRDIFGPLPFRDVAIEPAWRTSTVTALARGIYDEKAFDRMPILADALQDAGCDHDELLAHCRELNREHVRGCWVVDLILGKPWRETS